eukprot:TRINITY_DN29315_c0_g1_i1.p1 TRINITY_DN29315_c0_g1~~TRINITY_DN29315_c0_g1_i1.p1  ORF type:complete len:499 (+),score=118.18 TRINITY_DN29315_c0_g1_i1:22-1518(+)
MYRMATCAHSSRRQPSKRRHRWTLAATVAVMLAPPSRCFQRLGGAAVGELQSLPGKGDLGKACAALPELRLSRSSSRFRAQADEGVGRPDFAAFVAALAVALWVGSPGEARARDGTISPPTCVSIVDARSNCPARPAVGALKNVDEQMKFAEDRLAAAEKAAGKKLALGESETGEPEMVEFWMKERQRLAMNQAYIEDMRNQFAKDSQSRLVSRLSIEAADVQKEEEFWCEAIGMQRYATLPGGGVAVAFGPPGIKGEEGGFFSIEIRPASQSGSGASKPSKAMRLSFVQTTTPALIRISRVMASGGKLIDGYGYYGVQSPSGVQVRAYVDDRRDPVELVALAVPAGSSVEAESRALQQLGLKERGAYQLVSPTMQAYMPPLPEGNVLLGSGDPKNNVQVLLVPEAKEEQSSAASNLFAGLKEQFGRGPAAVVNTDGSIDVGILPEEEKVSVPISEVQAPQLTIFGPAGSPAMERSQDTTAGNGNEIRVNLRSISKAD